MKESKIDLTHRLHREDRWAEASKFKDDLITQLRAEGKTRKQAQQEAWEAMEQRFPPQEITEPDPTPVPELDADSIELADLETPSYMEDATWVYQRLSVKNLNPNDAPSPGAWGMLQWAKRNQNRFFEHIMPKVVSAQEKETDRAPGVVEDEYYDDVETAMRAMRPERWKWEKGAAANTDQAVRDKVASFLVSWEESFGLEIPPDAQETMNVELIKLADDLIRAALKHPDEYRTRQGEKF